MNTYRHYRTHTVAEDHACQACGSWFVVRHIGGQPTHPGLSWTPALGTSVQARCMACLAYWSYPLYIPRDTPLTEGT